MDFDELSTDAVVEGWDVTTSASLRVAAVPTAVDRSARLEGSDRSTACLPLRVPVGTLEAVFMVDSVDGAIFAMAIDFEDESRAAVQVVDGVATIGESSDHVALNAGAWYRWIVAAETDGFRSTLFDSAGETVATTEPVRGGGTAIQVCMSVVAPARAFLDELKVGTP